MDPDPHYYVSGSETPLATSAYTVAMLDTYDILHCTYIYVHYTHVVAYTIHNT